MTFKDAGWVRVTDAAGFDPGEEGLPDLHEHLTLGAPVEITDDGYIYVWVSNQSEATKVWFDDLTITHTQTMLTQATDYGVWGDVIREQRADEALYKYRFGYQGQFAEKDEETRWNHFELREYDPIIARMLVVDPFREFWSPYVAMGNNPINLIDINGGSTDPTPGQLNWDNSQFWGLNANTKEYEWVDVLSDVYVGPTFGDFLNDLMVLFEGDVGIRVWGSGMDNVFGGMKQRPKYVIDVSVEDMNTYLSLHKEWNMPGGSRFNANKLTVENSKNSEDLAKIKDAMNSLYEAYKIKHERFHGFVQVVVYGSGKEDYAYDTFPTNRSPITHWRRSDTLVIDNRKSALKDLWRKIGEKQRLNMKSK